ncbi:MFS transporter [Krasilnikovia sp. MM14-A1259]|uniref:MFS transporter n=1 Tax=Krasilnikovia sp. MM14-A1259 TaxID=3373539 RepID=UPI0038225ACD
MSNPEPSRAAPTVPVVDPPATLPQSRGLRSNRNFQLLWGGSAVSLLGLEAADIAYPLTILAITGSPAWAGVFGSVQLIAALLTGLPAGDLLDRHDPRRILIIAEVLRLGVMGGIAAAIAFDHVDLWYLMIAAAVLGAVLPVSSGARMIILRAVVPGEHLTSALARDEVRTSAAMLAGPPLGSLLFSLSRVLPFLTVAGSFLISTLTAMFIRIPARPAPQEATSAEKPPTVGYFARMASGLVAVWSDVTLRGAVLLVAAINTAGAPLVLIVVVVLRQRDTPPWLIGVVTSALALGGVAGAALIKPLHRLRPGLILILLGAVEAAVFALLALPWGPVWAAAMMFCAMLGVPSLRVLVDVLIFRQVQPEVRGRVVAGVMTLFTLGAPIGVGLSGVLLSTLPASTALLALAAALAVTVAAALFSRTLRTARWPGEAAP